MYGVFERVQEEADDGEAATRAKGEKEQYEKSKEKDRGDNPSSSTDLLRDASDSAVLAMGASDLLRDMAEHPVVHNDDRVCRRACRIDSR